MSSNNAKQSSSGSGFWKLLGWRKREAAIPDQKFLDGEDSMEPKEVDQELTKVAQEEKAAELLQKKAGAVLEYMVRTNMVLHRSPSVYRLELLGSETAAEIETAIGNAIVESGLVVDILSGPNFGWYIVDHEAIESAREKASTEVES